MNPQGKVLSCGIAFFDCRFRNKARTNVLEFGMTALQNRKPKNSLKSKNLCIILTIPIKSLETPPVTSSYQKNGGGTE